MPKVVSIINLKGGVGKTTLTVALADALASEHKKKVLVIDLDPQTNATLMLIGEERWREVNAAGNTLASLFRSYYDDTPFILPNTVLSDAGTIAAGERIHLLPSSIDLVEIQENLNLIPPGNLVDHGLTGILENALHGTVKQYDYVLIDCPPSLGTVTKNGLKLSQTYLVPAIPDYLSTYGIPQIMSSAERFAQKAHHQLKPLGILFNRVQRLGLHRQFIKDFRTRAGHPAGPSNLNWPYVFESSFSMLSDFAKAANFEKHTTLTRKYGVAAAVSVKAVTKEFIARLEAL